MSRVAILGSCITRDLWPIRGDAAGLLYVSRTSLPSLFARPLRGFRSRGAEEDGLTQYQRRALEADLTKTALRELVAFRPTHLIIDLIDERFDLMRAGEALFTHSWELEASGHLEAGLFAGAQNIPRLSAACDRLWEAAAAEFAALVRATPLADARLILHAARWAEVSRGPEGLEPLRDVQVLAGRFTTVGQHNDLLARYEAHLTVLAPQMIQVSAPDHRIADAGHRWGLSPFHYVAGYYEEIWGQLEALGVGRPA